MKLEIAKDDARRSLWADRDGVGNAFGRQGLSMVIGGLDIHFEDEEDAETMAKAVLLRLGALPQIENSVAAEREACAIEALSAMDDEGTDDPHQALRWAADRIRARVTCPPAS